MAGFDPPIFHARTNDPIEHLAVRDIEHLPFAGIDAIMVFYKPHVDASSMQNWLDQNIPNDGGRDAPSAFSTFSRFSSQEHVTLFLLLIG